MKQIFIVGAGRLGKGFIGETFDKAGWKIAFLDKDEEVVNQLKKQNAYSVTVHRQDRIEERTITNYEAYGYGAHYPCMDAVLRADVIALVIYPEDFEEAIAYLSPCLVKRAKENAQQNLDILCLTNKNYLMEGIAEQFLDGLKTEENRNWFKAHVSLRDTIIRRGTDADSNRALHVRTTAVLSLLIQSPLLVNLDAVEWMQECEHLELLKDLKVFMVNGPHVTAAFAGYLKGYKTLNEAKKDPVCAALTKAVREEIVEGILRGYPITKAELDKLSVFPSAKGEMEDYISRIAHDPIRKLSRKDRLTGIACVCLENGIMPEALAQAIANGFAYDYAQDPAAVQLQSYIKENGIRRAIVKFCGLDEGHMLVSKIEFFYQNIERIK